MMGLGHGDVGAVSHGCPILCLVVGQMGHVAWAGYSDVREAVSDVEPSGTSNAASQTGDSGGEGGVPLAVRCGVRCAVFENRRRVDARFRCPIPGSDIGHRIADGTRAVQMRARATCSFLSSPMLGTRATSPVLGANFACPKVRFVIGAMDSSENARAPWTMPNPSRSRSQSHHHGPLSPPLGRQQLDEGARLEPPAARLIRGYVARCAARTELPAGAPATEGEWNRGEDGVYCRAIPDGTLAKVRHGSTWVLFLEWNDGYGRRVLTQGTRDEVERHALDVARHGPVGGPDLGDQGTDWRRIGGDDTLRAVAPGGEFRLMPLFGGQHLLLFAGNESGLSVLGLGEAAELQRSAGERLAHFAGGTLQLGIGEMRVRLRAIGFGSVLGCVEMFNGARLLLGHLEGEQFGLFYVRECSGECVGLYDLASLMRGDLGQVIRWMREERRQVMSESEVGGEREPGPRVPEVSPSTREDLRVARSAAELALIERHLTPGVAVVGPGATVVPQLLDGIRGLVRLGVANQLLRGGELRALMEARCGLELYCCAKTLGQGLAWIAARTQLVQRVGKRWLIRFEDLRRRDSDLWRGIAGATPASEATAPVSSSTIGVNEARGESTSPPVMAHDLRASGASSAEDERGAPIEPWPRAFHGHRLRIAPEQLRRVTMASVPDGQSASRWQPSKRTRDPP